MSLLCSHCYVILSLQTIYQPFLLPVLPIPKPTPTTCVTQTPSHPLSFPMNFNSSAAEPPLDFSSPAHFTPCLDTSAARHRLSVKPRNQRASSKKRLPTVSKHTFFFTDIFKHASSTSLSTCLFVHRLTQSLIHTPKTTLTTPSL